MFALLSRSSSTSFRWPLEEAQWRGVCFFSSLFQLVPVLLQHSTPVTYCIYICILVKKHFDNLQMAYRWSQMEWSLLEVIFVVVSLFLLLNIIGPYSVHEHLHPVYKAALWSSGLYFVSSHLCFLEYWKSFTLTLDVCFLVQKQLNYIQMTLI